MSSYQLKLLRHFAFREDVSFLKADLHRHVLLMNAGYDKLRVLDIDTMSESLVNLAPITEEFLIHSWTLDQDGACSLLASSDPLPYVIGLSHRDWKPVRIELPEPRPMLSEFAWTAPRFAVMDLAGTVWNILPTAALSIRIRRTSVEP